MGLEVWIVIFILIKKEALDSLLYIAHYEVKTVNWPQTSFGRYHGTLEPSKNVNRIQAI